MKKVVSLVLASILVVSPAHAQTVNDDVRCLVVTSAVGEQAENEPTRKVANLTAAFYMGRLDGRVPATVAAALKSQPAVAGTAALGIFKACAARAQVAQARLRAESR